MKKAVVAPAYPPRLEKERRTPPRVSPVSRRSLRATDASPLHPFRKAAGSPRLPTPIAPHRRLATSCSGRACSIAPPAPGADRGRETGPSGDGRIPTPPLIQPRPGCLFRHHLLQANSSPARKTDFSPSLSMRPNVAPKLAARFDTACASIPVPATVGIVRPEETQATGDRRETTKDVRGRPFPLERSIRSCISRLVMLKPPVRFIAWRAGSIVASF